MKLIYFSRNFSKLFLILFALLITCINLQVKLAYGNSDGIELQKFILTDEAEIVYFLENSKVIAGAPKWSYQVAGTSYPWALLVKSEYGILNCYLTFDKRSIDELSCDEYHSAD